MVNDIREFKRLLEEIRWLDADLYGKDFLFTWERSIKEVRQVLFTAEALHWLYENNISTKCFESGVALLQTRDKHIPWDTCNRLCFGLAANLLGLTTQQVEYRDCDIRELCHSFLTGVEIVGVQDFTHRTGEELEEDLIDALARAEKKERVSLAVDRERDELSPRLPGIINLQCNWDTPPQAMADLLVLKNQFLSLERLAGKKIAVVWDNSAVPVSSPAVPQGFMGLVTRFGMEVNLAYPQGYDLNPHVIKIAHRHSESSSGVFNIFPSLEQALGGADAVCSMNWSNSLKKENSDGLKDWTCTPEKLKLSKDGAAFTMSYHHADSYKPFIIAAMMLNNRLKEPAKLLGNLRKRNTQRANFV